MDDDRQIASRKLQLAFELHEAGVQMYRARMRRENPGASDAEIIVLVGAWLQTRPGAEHGDAVGRRITDHPLLAPISDSSSD